MAVPRNRLSNARKNSKRAHHAKKPKMVTICTNCSAVRLPHSVCASCGHYGDRKVLNKDEQAS